MVFGGQVQGACSAKTEPLGIYLGGMVPSVAAMFEL